MNSFESFFQHVATHVGQPCEVFLAEQWQKCVIFDWRDNAMECFGLPVPEVLRRLWQVTGCSRAGHLLRRNAPPARRGFFFLPVGPLVVFGFVLGNARLSPPGLSCSPGLWTSGGGE